MRPAPVARAALGIMRVLRTIRNFLVNPPRTAQYDLTELYDLCISSLLQGVSHRREELETGQASLTLAESSQHKP